MSLQDEFVLNIEKKDDGINVKCTFSLKSTGVDINFDTFSMVGCPCIAPGTHNRD